MGQTWNYLGTTPPTGFSASDIKACYQFDGPTLGLTDRTGNGHTLTPSVAYGHAWIPAYEAFGCAFLLLSQSDCWVTTSKGATLGTTGNATMELVMMRYRMSSMDDTYNMYVSVGGTVSDPSENICFGLYGSTTRNRIAVRVQYNTKQNSVATNPEFLSFGIGGQLCYIAVVRTDPTTYELYVDGAYSCDITLGNAPTGATNVHLSIGGHNSANDTSWGIFQSVRWSHARMTAAQIQETYQGLHPGA